MKTMMNLSLLVAASILLITSCGGGSKSGLKENKYFGKLPAIYADYELAEKANEEKLEKLEAKGDLEAFMKENMKQKAAKKERKAKLEEDEKAEFAKIAGREIPFAFSQALKSANDEYDITAVKISDKGGIELSGTAKKDLEIDGYYNPKYHEFIYVRVIADDGSTIDVTAYMISKKDVKQGYTTGDALKLAGYIGAKKTEMSKFASIEFITKDEYEIYSKELKQK